MALPQQTDASPGEDVRRLERLATAVSALRRQVAQRIVGQETVVDGVLTALLAGGHSLLIGVPAPAGSAPPPFSRYFPVPLSWGTTTVVVLVVVAPAASVTMTVMV